MANQWLRLWHELPNDPKWRTIARASKQPITAVISVYLHILVNASANDKERGRTDNLCSEDIASALDMETEHVEQVLAAMQGRVLDGEHVSGWEKRQPVREDGATGGKSPGSNYVYYVATTDCDSIKVGISRNPWARTKDLQTGSAREYVLLATLKTDARNEYALHERLSASRLNGEWFKPTQALISLIEKTKSGELATLEECLSFLDSLPAESFVTTVVGYRSGVATTKDKDAEKEEIREEGNASVAPRRSSEPRGSRIPSDWQPSEALLTKVLEIQPTWTTQHALSIARAFHDYWTAEAGQKASKRDWDAAFRLWVSKEKPLYAKQGASTGNTLADHNRAVMQEALRRADQRNQGDRDV